MGVYNPVFHFNGKIFPQMEKLFHEKNFSEANGAV